MKRAVILITIITIAYILYFIFDQIKTSGKQGEEIKCVKEQIGIQHEVIKENKKVHQRKKVFKLVPTNDNINFLLKNNCKDCQGR